MSRVITAYCLPYNDQSCALITIDYITINHLAGSLLLIEIDKVSMKQEDGVIDSITLLVM